jgi:hypothetical protein
MTDKKPFKETKVGKVLSKLTGILPKEGVLGIVKNLLDSDDTLTPEEKKQALEQALEAYKIEVSDRDSARKREVELRKYGTDWMFNATGVVGLLAFAFLVYTVVTTEVPASNKEIFIHMIGIVEGVALSIFGYYFGSAVKQNKN